MYNRPLKKLRVFRDWIHTYLLTSKKKAVCPLGFKFVSGSYAENRRMQLGKYEKEGTDIIKRLLAGADLFVDVGANIGIFSCLARSMGKPAIAVEPQPRNLKYLYENLMMNGWNDTEVYPLGLSDKQGLSALYGASGPSASLVEGWAGQSKRFKQLIPVTTMDALLKRRFEGKNLLIKIDVEGAEYQVLLGAQKTMSLAPPPVWFVEIYLREHFPMGINPNYAVTFELFWSRGYKAYLTDKKMSPVLEQDVRRWAMAGHTDMRIRNYIFIHE